MFAKPLAGKLCVAAMGGERKAFMKWVYKKITPL